MPKPLNTIEKKIEPQVVKDILTSQFTNSKTKVANEVITMMTELAKLVVTEAATRAVLQAKQDRKAANNNKVTLDHIEAVLPQFMMDLP
ncbi:centromere protein X-like [Atheta coriaria]|uniref:centromere protein X-like n=1 Tax=Dalotia coriaria TaxID=877792 RepID=UPI0031F381A4